MSPQEAAEHIVASFAVTREDVARAKVYVLRQDDTNTNSMANDWLREQNLELRDVIKTDAPDAPDVLAGLGRSFSVRVALYTAVWELVAAGQLFPSHSPSEWKPSLTYDSSRQGGGIPLPKMSFHYLPHVHRPVLVTGLPDIDIFLQGIDCKSLDPGIREAIDQSLLCFRRDLYMPATAMLAAGIEATWTECGLAVAKKLGNSKLEGLVTEQMTGIGRIVMETRKALEDGAAKPLLKAAGQSMIKVLEAETWTTVLRDRRNALHWGKQKSFVADHSATASLLMGAPIHIGTLEAIRVAC